MHLRHLRYILLVLHREKLYADLQKCSFLSSKVQLLSYVVLSFGLSIDSTKIEVVRNCPIPYMIFSICRFHGFASIYHRFIPHFSSFMGPITDCICDSKFLWFEEVITTFSSIKNLLTSVLNLVLPNLE